MKESPFYYIVFAILYFISMKCLESPNAIIVGLGFLFTVNVIFTIYFLSSQIIKGFLNNGDDFLVIIGKSSILINSIFLMISLICAFVMITNINEKWKKKTGTSLELPPIYQKNMDMFVDSVVNNIYFEAIIILFIVFFKSNFNNVNQFDSTRTNGFTEYIKKLLKFIWEGLKYIFYTITFLRSRSYHTWLEKYFPTKYESFEGTDIVTFITQGLLYCIYYASWIPTLLILYMISFIVTIFTKILPEVYRRGFRYIYVTALPILSLVIIGNSMYQLHLASSFTKLQRQELI
jgi:hypothetical protein